MTKHFILTSLLFTLCFKGSAQQISDFESFSVNASGINNGSDNSGGFQNSGILFPNYYNNEFMYWTGFAISTKTDTTTIGFTNQYSSFSGSSFSGTKFGIGFASPPISLKNSETIVQKKLRSFRYTNNTYAALSMRNGDAFSKKFGGVSGNDPDYFKLKVLNYFNGVVTDTVSFYLADFRFLDNSQDYIVKNWQFAQTNFVNPFDSIQFELTSSDNGQFGMNTPAYFCLDDVFTELETSVSERVNPIIQISPNPAKEAFRIVSDVPVTAYSILSMDGRKIIHHQMQPGTEAIVSLTDINPGMYFLVTDSGISIRFQKL